MHRVPEHNSADATSLGAELHDDALSASVDDIVERFAAQDQAPGVVVGVLRDGSLAHVVGRGRVSAGDGPPAPPDELTVFAIASMTKSFTAATVLALRDQGALALDDVVARWLPISEPAPHGVPLTVRHLLTMTGGLATDDPWGDRQQSLPVTDFDRLLAAGMTHHAAPGQVWEYSNLGYAMLGRVITAVAGCRYDETVTDLLLAPLGLQHSAYDVHELPPRTTVASGYVPRDGDLVLEPLAPPGAFAPMGGLLSCVLDLATWVRGFLVAERRSATAVPDVHPLTAASRLEMSRQQRFVGMEVVPDPSGPDTVSSFGYGFGLLDEHSSRLGRMVHHSGGYPGYGSHMRWHPASGVGVVALANRTYAPMRLLATEVLTAVVAPTATSDDRRISQVRRPRAPSPALLEAAAGVVRLVHAWDDALADELFTPSMDQDEPRRHRTAAWAAVRDAVRPSSDQLSDVTSVGLAQLSGWLPGERGRARVEVLLSPQPQPRVQWATVTAVGRPDEDLVEAARTVLTAVQRDTAWPDIDADETSIRTASARLGPLQPLHWDEPVRGDGHDRSVWSVVGRHGRGELTAARADPGIRVQLKLSPRAIDDSGAER